MNHRSALFLTAAMFVGVCSAAGQQVSAPHPVESWFVDSLVKVFPEDVRPRDAAMRGQVIAARNGHGSIQLVLRSHRGMENVSVSVEGLDPEKSPRVKVQVRPVGYVVVAANTKDTSPSELIHSAPGLFPDVLLEDSAIKLEPGKTQSFWLTFRVQPDAAAGSYAGKAVVRQNGKPILTMPLTLRIVAATVPSERTLKVTNWFYLTDRQLKEFFKVKVLTEEWWQVLGNFARVMAEHRQNMIVTPLTGFYFSRLALIQAKPGAAGLEYDFTNFDRWVDVFQKAGVIGYIEGSHVVRHEDDSDDPTGANKVDVYVLEDGKAVLKPLALDDPRAPQPLFDMLSALHRHLQEKGWVNIYYQHILDEPGTDVMPMYLKYAELVHRAMPGVRTMDAVNAKQDLSIYEKTCDVWVPVLESFDNVVDRLHEHQRRGGEVWYYTCLWPRGPYANRFIDFSLVKVRLLQWINFRYDLPGYLHWGGDYWSPDPVHETEPPIGAGASASMLPSGDAFIAYPDAAKKSILSSIRWEAMLEGIEDYELLRVLDQRDSTAARGLAAKMVRTFTDYVRDPAEFRKVHNELLEALPR